MSEHADRIMRQSPSSSGLEQVRGCLASLPPVRAQSTRCIGAYSLNNNVFDVYMTIPFTILGYAFKKLDCEPAPLLLGFVLGKLMEEYLRRAMTISRPSGRMRARRTR